VEPGDAHPGASPLLEAPLLQGLPGSDRETQAVPVGERSLRSLTALTAAPKDAAVQRETHGRQFLGADTILRQDPRTEPNRTKKSPAPRFHAVRKWVRKELYQTYTLFEQAYREAPSC
jgi:hypothetical protein